MKHPLPPRRGRKPPVLALLLALLVPAGIPGPAGAAPPPGDANATLTLEAAVAKALADNAAVRRAAELERAQAEALRSARADLLPSLSASYTFTGLKDAPYVVFGGLEVPMGDRNQYRWDVTLRQPIFTGFALVTRRRIAELGLAGRRVERAQAEMEITKSVKVAYYRILLARRQVRVAEEAVEQLAAHERTASRFYDQGLIPRNDLLKARVALAEARQDAVRARRTLALAKADLNRLLRLPIDAPTRVAELEAPPLRGFDLAALQEEAVRKRPELKALRLAVRRAALGVTLARSRYWPRVSLAASYERTGQGPLTEANDYGNPYNASVLVRAEWDLFDWGKRGAEAARAEHERNALDERLAEVEDAVRMEVKQAGLDLEVARTNIRTAEAALAQARENFRLTRLRYENQLATSTDVLDAQTFLTRAETHYYAARYGYLTALAELEQAVGRPLPE
ncbi:TolC family protein [Dissulfurirhabdus thermomarina]|uniref:TolC family protein n=1 Tax=Dissulfurirhabdus thermomarina TaxID=1765737 RepID=A0A6N9TLP7_DISTH|nr:TolC family protein [Dissulfurirhabdus thermomarina]NDY42201.1 TolC family protein [Dissulfurirhabdus thermomarina]NMX22671.1 TolC family protein [Dissulfurirhabdus thermomarina]